MKKLLAMGLSLSLVFGGISTFITPMSSKVEASGFVYTQQQQKALDYVNNIRRAMGLKEVVLNPFLNKAAENHANYINQTGILDHIESQGNKGFTGVRPTDRVKAVGGSEELAKRTAEVIAFNSSNPIDAINEFITTAYHREPFVDPNTTEMGVGIAGNTVVVNPVTNKEKTDTIGVYPYDGQKNVGIGFYGAENPNPLEKLGVDKSGFIISFSASKSSISIDSVEAKLMDSKGNELPFFSEMYIGSTVFLYPKKELSYNETYTVSVKARGLKIGPNGTIQQGEEMKTWSFTTKKDPNAPLKDIEVKLNGEVQKITPAPKLQNGSTFVPLRGIFEKLNAIVGWDGATRTATVVRGSTIVKVTINNKTAYVNGQAITLSQAPFISNGSTFVPLRFISEAIGAKVGWDGVERVVSIDIQ